MFETYWNIHPKIKKAKIANIYKNSYYILRTFTLGGFMSFRRVLSKLSRTILSILLIGSILKNDTIGEKIVNSSSLKESYPPTIELIASSKKAPVSVISPVKTTAKEKNSIPRVSPLGDASAIDNEQKQIATNWNSYGMSGAPIQLQGIDLAIATHDPILASVELKKITDKEPDEASKILVLVSTLEGKHLDMPELMPGIEKQDPIQALLIRKALRHQYMTTRDWLLPVAIQNEDLDAIHSLEQKIRELEKINETMKFK